MKPAPCFIFWWMMLWFVASCGNSGTYRLHLSFPDQEARDSVKQVALFALDPGSHSCQELIQGQISPAMMTVFSQLIVDVPNVQPVSLPLVPARKVLFYAEGRVGSAVLLRGCDSGLVKGGAQVEISISMEWICHPNPQGEVPGNGIDDDCDGQTDETQICSNGELRLCTCPGGQQGTQACAQDQTHWEDCRCLEEPDGGTEDGGIDPDQSGTDDGDHATDDGGVTDEGAADLLPPVRSNPSPQGQLASGTTNANLSLSTDEPSSCRYATTPGVLYDNMTNAFNTSNGLSHLVAVAGLADGNSYSFQVRCRDQFGNTNLDDYTIAFSVSEAIDSTPPLRSNGSPSGTLTAGTTSTSLTLNTNEDSFCRYDTVAGTTFANMTILFNTANGLFHQSTVSGLTNGTSYSFYTRCQDQVGNANPDDYVIQFSVALPGDNDPPVRSNGAPSGELAAGTTSAHLSLNTNEYSECRYAQNPGVGFDSMSNLLQTSDGLAHQTDITGLSDGQTYSFFVRCKDLAGNANPDDYLIQFSVLLPDTTPPVRSDGAPTGTLASGTTYTVLTLNTNEYSECRVAQNPGVGFDSMSTLFSSSDGLAHQSNVSGLSDGQTYNFYVRCKDLAGNANLDDYVISFSVASAGDTTPPVRSNGSPTGVLSADAFIVTLSLTTDEVSQCRVDLLPGTPYASMPYSIDTADGMTHAKDVPGMDSGQSYTFYVRCQDVVGNANANDYLISFQLQGYTAKPIYRSVGVGSPGPLQVGSSGANQLSTFLTAAQFSQSINDMIGVGDILKYDFNGDGTMEALAMITRRSDNKLYQIHATDGSAAPSVNTPTTNWAIYRAYNSLANAISADENQNIGSNFDSWTTGAPPNLVNLNAVWNIACYADDIDTDYVMIQNWTTGAQNYLRIFTPHLPTEVGTSQRHLGVWTSNAYTLQNISDVLDLRLRYAQIEGLQVDVLADAGSCCNLGISVYPASGPGLIGVNGNIIRGHADGVSGEHFGAEIWGTPANVTLQLWNNVVYGFSGAATHEAGVLADSGVLLAYNNTFAQNSVGIEQTTGTGTVRAINNLFVSCVTPGSGTFLNGTDYNATDGSSLSYTVSGGGNTHDRLSQTFSFFDAATRNYHLLSSDTGARDCGTDQMSATFNDDIDGQTRQAPWDIGADEYVP